MVFSESPPPVPHYILPLPLVPIPQPPGSINLTTQLKLSPICLCHTTLPVPVRSRYPSSSLPLLQTPSSPSTLPFLSSWQAYSPSSPQFTSWDPPSPLLPRIRHSLHSQLSLASQNISLPLRLNYFSWRFATLLTTTASKPISFTIDVN